MGLRGMSLPRLGHDPRQKRDRSSPPLEWVSELGCWCVYDAEAVTAILKSRDFAAVDFVELHRAYEQNIGIDCSALIAALQQTPTSHEGERHAKIRRDLARLLATHSAEMKQHAGAKIRKLVPELCRPGTRVDLVKDIVRPVCNDLFYSVLGVTASGQAEEGVSASQVFDIYLSLNRRREINVKARALIEGFSAANGKLKTTPEYAAALSMLGYDSLVGSLGGSLLHVLRNAAGQRLCDIVFPRVLPATGVPYIERFAAKDSVIGGASIRKGDRIRLFLDSGTPGEDASNRPYFGRGRHSCLGEEISTWLWRSFAEEFSRSPLRCTIESVTRRKPDWVFAYYSSIVVQFHA